MSRGGGPSESEADSDGQRYQGNYRGDASDML